MNLKKCKIIGIIGLFLISFLCHFMYKWFPNVITSIFFPVNESIFEHMKIISTSVLIYSIIELFICTKFKIKINNYIFNIFITSFFGIVFYLIIFIPIYLLIGENMFISLFLLFITYTVIEIISYHLLNYDEFKYGNNISVFLIIILYIIFGYLTYNPPFNFLFLDTITDKYGINIYEI